jgi:hypothetical protein
MSHGLKDNGKRKVYASGMMREPESGKPRFDLMCPEDIPYEDQMLYRFAMQMSKGADKYDVRQWESAHTAEELERYKSGAFRHFMQWLTGEDDEDHAAALFFNITAAEAVKYKLDNAEGGKDDPSVV